MGIAIERGWHEQNEPVCAGCAYPIRVRGEQGNAVLVGEVLECHWSGGVWLAHFGCRRPEWHHANLTDDPFVRKVPEFNRTYRLLTDRHGWALTEPEFMSSSRHDTGNR